jgi:hypothetical protein
MVVESTVEAQRAASAAQVRVMVVGKVAGAETEGPTAGRKGS